MLRDLFYCLRALFRRNSMEADLDAELRAHVEQQAEKYVQSGMSPQEAARRARLEFGGVEQVKEECRDSWGVRLINELVQDLRYGLRQLRRNPGFTAVAVITLAIGIGATGAIFTVFNAVLLRPLPYSHPSRLVYISENLGPKYGVSPYMSYKEFAALRDQNRTLSSIADYMFSFANLAGEGKSQHVIYGLASASFFSLLHVHPLLGRLFLPQEDHRGGPLATILTHGLWVNSFRSDPHIVGKSITLEGKSYTVVGVLPPGFAVPEQYPVDYELWVPLANGGGPSGSLQPVKTIGRLKPGVSLASANSELNTILQSTLRKGLKLSIALSNWQNEIVSKSRRLLMLFMGAVGILLLIACVNVANLMLARSAYRQKEMAVRLAVGAGKPRIIRQLLTESMLLAFAGGGMGLALAGVGKKLLILLISRNLPSLEPIRFDWRVFGFAAGATVLTGILFGIVPAVQTSKVPLDETLKEATRNTSEMRSQRSLRSVLVIAETALAMVLLIGAGLFFKGFLAERGIDMGFKSSNILCMTVDLTPSQYPNPNAQSAFFQQVIDRIKGLPGVRSVAGDSFPPLGNRRMTVRGARLDLNGKVTDISDAGSEFVTPDYFRTMGLPLGQGRFFTDADREGSLSVAIVNQAFAHVYCPEKGCLGARIESGVRNKELLMIVGVVGNARLRPEMKPFPEIYLPYLQAAKPYMTILTRTAGNPLHWASAVRSQVSAVDQNQPPYDIATLDELRARFIAPRRVNMLLLGSFALLGLVLAAVGIYGVVSYSVSRRTHEVGIRMALGAERRDVLKLVISQGIKLALIGLGIGIAGALALTRFLSSLLYGVTPTDPITFIAVSLILIAVALVACYIPARRAAKVDPMVALRYE
jgi:putative ABC transport system permease protein